MKSQTRSAPPGQNRLYKTDGMIPKYTGYIPRKYYIVDLKSLTRVF